MLYHIQFIFHIHFSTADCTGALSVHLYSAYLCWTAVHGSSRRHTCLSHPDLEMAPVCLRKLPGCDDKSVWSKVPSRPHRFQPPLP